VKYRKKPIVIEAFQWTGDQTQLEDPDWACKAVEDGTIYFEGPDTSVEMKIETLEGELTASKGDYIIKGINGELYPCKPDIFEKTYELVIDE
jgi:hypothetical protein